MVSMKSRFDKSLLKILTVAEHRRFRKSVITTSFPNHFCKGIVSEQASTGICKSWFNITAPERVEIEVGDKLYSVSTTKIPYFTSYLDFQCHSGQASKKHDKIPFFEVAHQAVERGFRHCFRNLEPDVTSYHTLCNTLDFFCINVLGGRSVDAVIGNLKSGKGYYETDYKRSCFVKGNKAIARDNCFRLLYLILRAEFKDDVKASQQIYQAVIFVVSYRAIFKYRARKAVRAAYEDRFLISKKQAANLNRWPILEPGPETEWSDDDVTTEDSSACELDSDDY